MPQSNICDEHKKEKKRKENMCDEQIVDQDVILIANWNCFLCTLDQAIEAFVFFE